MDDFNKIIQDENIIRITRKASKKFHKLLSKEEIKSCILYAMWKAYSNYNPTFGSKFTTYLYQGVIIECLTQVKFNRPKKKLVCIHDNMPSNETPTIDILDEIFNKCDDPQLIYDKFFNNKSINEIAQEYGICGETVRIRIKKNLKKLKRSFI